VDGLHCSHNLASNVVVVGTGLVSHKERISFKLKVDTSLEAQVRAHPKFAALVAAAAAGPKDLEVEVERPAQELDSEPRKDEPVGVLFAGTRRLPSRPPLGAPRALAPSKLENDLGVAWELQNEAYAARKEEEREAERQRVAAQRELVEAQSAAREASRKRNREAREASEPCLCTAAGAAELLRESQQQTRDALKLVQAQRLVTLHAQGKLTAWLKRPAPDAAASSETA